MAINVAGIAIPDTAIARAAAAVARGSGPDILFRHSSRVFLFASMIAAQKSTTCDLELLYVASAFQNVGLSTTYRNSRRRFEVDGADAAKQFLLDHGVAEYDALGVWSAIALHTTSGIEGHPSPLVELLRAGVETDLLAMHFDEVTESQRREVLLAFPRGRGFKSLVIEAFAEGILWRPETTLGTVNADVLDRCDPSYRRINYCGLILGSEWND
jgi:hypothetical protein